MVPLIELARDQITAIAREGHPLDIERGGTHTLLESTKEGGSVEVTGGANPLVKTVLKAGGKPIIHTGADDTVYTYIPVMEKKLSQLVDRITARR